MGKFTQSPVTDPNQLHLIARLAGDEARRIEAHPGECIRTWEEVKDMTDEERLQGMSAWPKLTENKVALHVSHARGDADGRSRGRIRGTYKLSTSPVSCQPPVM